MQPFWIGVLIPTTGRRPDGMVAFNTKIPENRLDESILAHHHGAKFFCHLFFELMEQRLILGSEFQLTNPIFGSDGEYPSDISSFFQSAKGGSAILENDAHGLICFFESAESIDLMVGVLLEEKFPYQP